MHDRHHTVMHPFCPEGALLASIWVLQQCAVSFNVTWLQCICHRYGLLMVSVL